MFASRAARSRFATALRFAATFRFAAALRFATPFFFAAACFFTAACFCAAVAALFFLAVGLVALFIYRADEDPLSRRSQRTRSLDHWIPAGSLQMDRQGSTAERGRDRIYPRPSQLVYFAAV